VSITLASLVSRLQIDVPVRHDVPTTAQYEQAVKDAVRDYSRRRPMERVATVEVTSGVADYALPADFVRLIALVGLPETEGVIHTPSGLVPMAESPREYWTIAGAVLTLHPTPQYNVTRQVRYAAGHILTEGAYPDLTDDDVSILMLKAQSLVLRAQARAAAIVGQMVEYQIGDERVKRESAASALTTAAKMAEADYEMALVRAIGPVGLVATY